jgi:hypothetical protein
VDDGVNVCKVVPDDGQETEVCVSSKVHVEASDDPKMYQVLGVCSVASGRPLTEYVFNVMDVGNWICNHSPK